MLQGSYNLNEANNRVKAPRSPGRQAGGQAGRGGVGLHECSFIWMEKDWLGRKASSRLTELNGRDGHCHSEGSLDTKALQRVQTTPTLGKPPVHARTHPHASGSSPQLHPGARWDGASC